MRDTCPVPPSTTTSSVLTRRALNRATLQRQLLLHRAERPALSAIEDLVGLQAQTPHSWYVGLWTRLRGFRAAEVADLLNRRDVVRVALMRSTIHLVSAADCLTLRPLVQQVIERSMSGNFGARLAGVDRAALTAAGRAIVDAEPTTPAELGRRLAKQWPDRDPAALAQAIRAWVPLVQVPPRGLWGRSGRVAHTSAESWLGRPLAVNPSPDDMVLRYLGAFGPASVKDVQTWSGLTRLREVIDRLRPRLVTFRDERGTQLFDLPDAPRPDPDTPAPARFLYDFDNLLLSHADRSRVISDGYFEQGYTMDGPMPSIVLIDGFTAASWKITRERRGAILTIRPFRRLSDQDAEAVRAEGQRLLEFAAADATTREIAYSTGR